LLPFFLDFTNFGVFKIRVPDRPYKNLAALGTFFTLLSLYMTAAAASAASAAAWIYSSPLKAENLHQEPANQTQQ
jgi:hypothetical protein